MKNNVNLKSAIKYSVAYADEKNTEALNNYKKILDKKQIAYRTDENLKNCLLFAGALIDEVMGFDEETTKQCTYSRQYYQDRIAFAYDDWQVVRQNLQDLCNALIREDKELSEENVQHYKDVYKVAKQILTDIYNEKKEKNLDEFMGVLKWYINQKKLIKLLTIDNYCAKIT